MLSLTAEITIWYCFICTPGMQWLLEKSENELPTETWPKLQGQDRLYRAHPKEMRRERGDWGADVTGQVSVRGPSTSMSSRSDMSILADSHHILFKLLHGYMD